MKAQLKFKITDLSPDDVVRLTPLTGCCNSTLCFTEWVVVSTLQLPKVETLYVIRPKHGASGQWRVARLREIDAIVSIAEDKEQGE